MTLHTIKHLALEKKIYFLFGAWWLLRIYCIAKLSWELRSDLLTIYEKERRNARHRECVISFFFKLQNNCGFQECYNDNLTDNPDNLQGSRRLERVYSYVTYIYHISMYSIMTISVIPVQDTMTLNQSYLKSRNYDMCVDLSSIISSTYIFN